MKHLFFQLVLWSLILSACQSKEPAVCKKTGNALLPTEIVVKSETPFVNTDFKSWTEGVDNAFFSQVIPDILASDIQLFDAWLYPGLPIWDSISKDRVQESLANLGDYRFESVLFYEKWDFDAARFKLDKTVVSWTPTFTFLEGQNAMRKVIFMINNQTNKSKTEQKIAENISYEVNVSDNTYCQYLDAKKLAHLVLDSALCGKKPIFDLYTGKMISVDIAKKNMGFEIDTVEMEDLETGLVKYVPLKKDIDFESVKSFIFREDWFFDASTKSIRKEVKAICPLRITYDIDDDGIEYERRIPIGFVKLN